MAFYRDTWVEVNLDAIAHNVLAIKKMHPTKALCAVVKANGYGHGDIEVARIALQTGVDFLAVSGLDEAMMLRKADIVAPILVLGMTRIKDVELAVLNNISLTAHDEQWINELLQLELSAPVNVHLKVDSGMHRLGLTTVDQVQKNFKRLKAVPHVVVEGVFTHMATADNDEPFLQSQLKMFEACLKDLDLSDVKYVHVSNTATLMQYEFEFDHAIRLGLGLYGLNPDSAYIPLDIDLKPALGLYSKLVQVKKVAKGLKVGYGATYEVAEDEWIGVVPIGYADGWVRAHQGRYVYVEGHACEIVGRVCMDQMMIRLPYEMPMGSRVTLIGKEMSVEQVAKELGTISYEVLCTISDRVTRVYKQDNQVVAVRKMRFEHE